MKLDAVHALFFDFDGVILDSTKIKTEAFRNMFRMYGPEIEAKVIAYHQNHGGISRVEKIKHFYKEFLGKPLSCEQIRKKAEVFSQMVKDLVVSCNWISGAKEFLDKFHDMIPLVVISGTPEEELLEIIERRKMSFYFKHIYGSPIKKPEHVNSMLEKYNWRPEYCFFIGDASTDQNAAIQTKVNFIGIQGEIDFPEGTTVLNDCTSLQKAIEEF